jgi:hypothetical protein
MKRRNGARFGGNHRRGILNRQMLLYVKILAEFRTRQKILNNIYKFNFY